MKKCFIFFLVFSPLIYAIDELPLPTVSDNSGENRLERINKIEKELITLYSSFNDKLKEDKKISEQFIQIKKEISAIKDSADKALKENEELKALAQENKNLLSNLSKKLEQTRDSLYGETGKKEKDEILKEKR